MMYRHYWCVKWYIVTRIDGIVESCATGHFDSKWRGDPDILALGMRESVADREGIDLRQVFYGSVDTVEFEI